MSIKVIGHLNPDTDSICSSIVYAWYYSEILKINATPFSPGLLNKETHYILNRFKVPIPLLSSEFNFGDKVILVDTNNTEELVSNYENIELVEIIDHHKLFGKLFTTSPVNITFKTYGSTSTIIWTILKEISVTINEKMASLLLSAIISDTLKLSTPTTTIIDIKASNDLAEITKINVDTLAFEMFNAKSDLSGITIDEIIHTDSKIFNINGKKLRISILETTKIQNVLNLTDQIKNRMIIIKKEEQLDGILFYIIDIIYGYSEVIVADEWERKLISEAFNVNFIAETANLPNIVSRKKQIVPALEAII